MRIQLLRVIAVLPLVCLVGCTSIREVRLPSPERPGYELRLKPGRAIVAQMRDGTVHEFTLVKQEPDALTGENVRVPIADIAVLKVQRLNQGATWTLATIGGILLTFAAFALAASQSSTGT